eukprot:gene5431-6110_t
MGGCVSRRNREPSSSVSSSNNHSNSRNVTIGKNRQLSPEKPKWKSEVALTRNQLQSKRDEFWETSPAYEGKREIWDALKAACETDDVSLAQAIVDGANIILPTGSLTDAYDELGNHYVIPVYCVSLPLNLITNEEQSGVSSTSKESVADESVLGEEFGIRCRLSTTCKDHKINVRGGELVGSVKKRLGKELAINPSTQRWFFSGKMLYDKMTIEETRIQKGFVIQVVILGAET